MEPKQQEQQTRRNKNTGKLIIIVLMLIVITASLIFATWAWAKYSESFQENATVDVAKWNITANVTNESTWSKTFTHVTDQAIAPGTSGYIPIDIYMNDTEVCARYTISIYEATGNVPTNLRVYRGKYDATNGYGKLNANDSGSSLIGANTSPVIIAIDTIGVPQSTGTVNHTTEPTPHHAEYTNTTTNQVESGHVREYIYWEWPYETGAVNEVTGIAEGDVQDTIDGENAITNPTMTIGIKIETEQINPLGETPYRITYNLDGGTLATSNPTTYILETSGFTLNNPTKEGYTFIGWSGTDLIGNDNLIVTVLYGSSGDREYTANWRKNIQYKIRYNINHSDLGTGTMSDQTMIGNVAADLTANNFTRIGYEFTGWNTAADGSGQAYADCENVNNLTETENDIVILYAQWKPLPVKYAVQIYGINQDVDASGNTLGLTFGPATGDNYNTKYVTHRYDENGRLIKQTYTIGNATPVEVTLNITRSSAEIEQYGKKIHDMSWAEIAAEPNKEVFTDSMLCGDTKSIVMNLNSTIRVEGFNPTATGDGAGLLYNCINAEYRKWNYTGNNDRDDKAYASSRIRATLIGNNDDTKAAYAGPDLLDSSTCLYSCIETDLKNLITAKKVKYATGTSTSNYVSNDDIADKIWLFSEIEVNGTAPESGGTGTEGIAYQKFTNSASSATSNICCRENGGVSDFWWIRSPDLRSTNGVRGVFGSGEINSELTSNVHALAFGFCIR